MLPIGDDCPGTVGAPAGGRPSSPGCSDELGGAQPGVSVITCSWEGARFTGRIGVLCRPSCHGGCGRPRGIRLLIDNRPPGTGALSPFVRFGRVSVEEKARYGTTVLQVTFR
ncbi:hypothetical protein GCM10018781_70710 [Kitasatospora indigofera]|uniref:Uncharacterized protein n=1 Tax=Kitasatospora indigofera TaxID=67307 RepID=A0A919GFB5_9ACTN|nr:hypothetical protein GCM10018781_70710 [Kitasatospora indigofera]